MKTCEEMGHDPNRHHYHCYHCGRTTGNHHSWCPDHGAKPDSDMVGTWYYGVGCREVDIAYGASSGHTLDDYGE